jgi:hypothetical protein
MNEEQQRIAIAEACGLINVRMWSESCIASMGVSDEGKYWGSLGVPDYLNDLNAMHKAEKWLIEDDQHAYGCYCIDLQEEYGNTVHLTAAQRAEAFLRTIGKWTTNQNEL